MTVVRMSVIWDWMAARLVDPPPGPRFKVSLFFLPVGAAGRYVNGTLICKPWASRIIVIHEAAHWLWEAWNVEHTAAGRAFLDVTGQPWWNEKARETWCATFVAVLVDRPGVWKQPISGAVPVREAAWTFTPFLKEKP